MTLPTEVTATLYILEGCDTYLLYYETGVEETAKILADHVRRTNNVCTSCHQAAPMNAITTPHKIEGTDDYLLCHNQKVNGSFPVDHRELTNNTYLLCYKPARDLI